jgi:spermidine synthase
MREKRQHGELKNIGVVGLGVGTIACYGTADISVKFYEIDPVMVELARQQFTYLENCSDNLSIQVTDGRLGLNKEKDGLYDVLVMDAFSSDSIPTHLLSLEAISMYTDKLTSTGTLLFHTSNRYVDLHPVLAKIAERIGFKAYIQSYQPNAKELDRGALASDWVMLTRNNRKTDMETGPWLELVSKPEYPLWTDRYSNLFEVVAWDRVLWL